VGRRRELAELTELLCQPDVRLVTVTGPGGAGKTRLALQTAADLIEDFRDGTFFVQLAGVTEPSLVLPVIARTIGVQETGGLTSAEAAAGHLRSRETLLVLDNFEHVLEAAPLVGALVSGAPGVNAICSSRAALRLSGEHEYVVPELAPEDAVVLFAERAKAIDGEFRLNGDARVVAEICRRLDGLPLAIELAAARTKVLTRQGLLDRLDRRLPLLTGGARDLPDRRGRSETPSRGATSCLTRSSRLHSRASRSSREASPWTRPSGCAAQTSTRSRLLPRRASCAGARTGSGCWRRSASSG